MKAKNIGEKYNSVCLNRNDIVKNAAAMYARSRWMNAIAKISRPSATELYWKWPWSTNMRTGFKTKSVNVQNLVHLVDPVRD